LGIWAVLIFLLFLALGLASLAEAIVIARVQAWAVAIIPGQCAAIAGFIALPMVAVMLMIAAQWGNLVLFNSAVKI
jgi:hypothetical protein